MLVFVDAINFIKKDLTWTNLPADGADQLAKVTKASRNMPGMSDFLNELKEKAFAALILSKLPKRPASIIQIYQNLLEKQGIST